MADIYGIGSGGKVKLKGFSREEAYAYIECEGVHGDYIIRKHEGQWWSVSSDRGPEEE